MYVCNLIHRWKKKEHKDFVKTVMSYGIPHKTTAVAAEETQEAIASPRRVRDWSMFRELSKLHHKTDALLDSYYAYVYVYYTLYLF